jgi:hypothetical protein
MTLDGAPSWKYLTFLDRQQYTTEGFEIEELSHFNQEEALSSKSKRNSKKKFHFGKEKGILFSQDSREGEILKKYWWEIEI